MDLLCNFEGVQVKDSLLVINLRADEGNRSPSRLISLHAFWFGRIVVLLKWPSLKANRHEQRIDEFW